MKERYAYIDETFTVTTRVTVHASDHLSDDDIMEAINELVDSDNLRLNGHNLDGIDCYFDGINIELSEETVTTTDDDIVVNLEGDIPPCCTD